MHHGMMRQHSGLPLTWTSWACGHGHGQGMVQHGRCTNGVMLHLTLSHHRSH